MPRRRSKRYAWTDTALVVSSARLGWAALAILHLRVLAGVIARVIDGGLDIASVASAAALSVALALFVLKAFDAPFLRLRTKRHALIAFCLVTALVHRDAVAPAFDERAVVEIGAIAAGSAGAIASIRIMRIMRRARWLDGVKAALAGAFSPRVDLEPLGCTPWRATTRPATALVDGAAAPRGPPAIAR